MSEEAVKEHRLDLKGVPCPMNFVKVRLYLDKMSAGEILHAELDNGEPVQSVSGSIVSEGHEILKVEELSDAHSCLTIRKQ